MADWARLLNELGAPDPDDTMLLIGYLERRGAGEQEIRDALHTGSLGPLALELAIRPQGEMVPFEEAARQAGLELDEAVRLWRALGFPNPLDPPVHVSATRVGTLRLLAGMTRLMLGSQTTLRLARVLGSSAAQLAESIVDAFRINVEMPQRDRGVPASKVVEDYANTASVAIPALTEAIGDVFCAHLLTVARASWALDEQREAITRDLAVGFADLVGYTQTAQSLAPSELAAAIESFESLAGEIIGSHHGRLVKLIGDEVMFAFEDAGRAVRAVCQLLDEVSADPRLPALRVGLAAGPVVSHHGDYYGEVVNLAARLVKVARPGTALVADAVVERAGAGVAATEATDLPALKGFDGAVRAYELMREAER
jgi:adenylate cyclase